MQQLPHPRTYISSLHRSLDATRSTGGPPVTAVDDLLEKYSLTRDNAAAYIDAIVRMNQSETADEVELTRQTVNRYKNAFAQMEAEERAFLVASLFDERWRELARSE